MNAHGLFTERRWAIQWETNLRVIPFQLAGTTAHSNATQWQSATLSLLLLYRGPWCWRQVQQLVVIPTPLVHIARISICYLLWVFTSDSLGSLESTWTTTPPLSLILICLGMESITKRARGRKGSITGQIVNERRFSGVGNLFNGYVCKSLYRIRWGTAQAYPFFTRGFVSSEMRMSISDSHRHSARIEGLDISLGVTSHKAKYLE